LDLRSGWSPLPEPGTITAGWDAAGDWRRGDGQAPPARPALPRGNGGGRSEGAECMPRRRNICHWSG